MSNLYYIPGMGTDERIFQRLAPLIASDWTPHYLLHQAMPEESMSAYGARLAKTLESTNEPLVLLGLSLGGPIAIEIARRTPHAAVILVSTYKQQLEEPLLFKAARLLPLHRWVPYGFTCRMVPYMARWTGMANREESQLLRAMFDNSGAEHFAWARQAIVQWTNTWLPDTYLHLNGTRDHIFASANSHATHLIQGGTHNMVLNQARALAAQINPFLTHFQNTIFTKASR